MFDQENKNLIAQKLFENKSVIEIKKSLKEI